MILKINPADVVSVPKDYNGAKGRCCKYTVVAQVNGSPAEAFAKVVNGDYDPKPVIKPAPGKQAKPDAKPAAKVSTGIAPNAAWPFPTGLKPPAATVQLYDVRRVNGSALVMSDVSLADALAKVKKNRDQKKAQLQVVLAGTNTPV
jgi:hypothetical protein